MHDERDVEEFSPFDSVVEQLIDDPVWQRRVRRVRLRHACTRGLCWALHCVAEVGCWFTYVPPQRCTHRVAPQAPPRPR